MFYGCNLSAGVLGFPVLSWLHWLELPVGSRSSMARSITPSHPWISVHQWIWPLYTGAAPPPLWSACLKVRSGQGALSDFEKREIIRASSTHTSHILDAPNKSLFIWQMFTDCLLCVINKYCGFRIIITTKTWCACNTVPSAPFHMALLLQLQSKPSILLGHGVFLYSILYDYYRQPK